MVSNLSNTIIPNPFTAKFCDAGFSITILSSLLQNTGKDKILIFTFLDDSKN